MLKKSLLTAVILGALVVAAGAQGGETLEERVEKAKRFQKPQPAFVLDAPEAQCDANATEASQLSSKADTNILEQQNASQLDELGFRPRYCYFTKFGIICF